MDLGAQCAPARCCAVLARRIVAQSVSRPRIRPPPRRSCRACWVPLPTHAMRLVGMPRPLLAHAWGCMKKMQQATVTAPAPLSRHSAPPLPLALQSSGKPIGVSHPMSRRGPFCQKKNLCHFIQGFRDFSGARPKSSSMVFRARVEGATLAFRLLKLPPRVQQPAHSTPPPPHQPHHHSHRPAVRDASSTRPARIVSGGLPHKLPALREYVRLAGALRPPEGIVRAQPAPPRGRLPQRHAAHGARRRARRGERVGVGCVGAPCQRPRRRRSWGDTHPQPQPDSPLTAAPRRCSLPAADPWLHP